MSSTPGLPSWAPRGRISTRKPFTRVTSSACETFASGSLTSRVSRSVRLPPTSTPEPACPGPRTGAFPTWASSSSNTSGRLDAPRVSWPRLLQHLRDVGLRRRRVELPRRVDVPLRGRVALVPHQVAQGVGRQLVGVHRRERPAQVVEAVDVAVAGVLVRLVAGQPDLGGLLDQGELLVEGGLVVRPGEDGGV